MAGGLQQHDDEFGGGMLSEINVTPLVDVMLVLLIIFMVTAPLLQQGMEVQLPAASTENMPGDDTTMVITLNADASIFMLKTEVSPEELREKLTALAQVNPNKEIFLKADTAVPYGKVVTVMSIIREAGLSRLGVVTQPGQEEL